jgi:hypothetical protein
MARGMRSQVKTFADFIVATRGRPLLKVPDQRLIRGPFWVAVTLTDNAVVAASLTAQSSWDKRVQTLYGSAATAIKANLHLEGFGGLYINDSDYRGETLALKESLDNLAYVHAVRGGKTMDWPLRSRIFEPWNQFQFAQASAAADERALHRPNPWVLERPYRLDLETDQFTVQVDTAINWGTGNILGYLQILGFLAPKDFMGTTGVDDTSCSDQNYGIDEGGLPTAVGPMKFAELGGIGLGTPASLGALVGNF